MAIIDNLQKISDTVWELPSSYKAQVCACRLGSRTVAGGSFLIW